MLSQSYGRPHQSELWQTPSQDEVLRPQRQESFNIARGDKILRATKTGYMGGMLDAARELRYACVGLLFGITEPSGTISDTAYESMRDELLARLDDAMASSPLMNSAIATGR